MKKLYIIEVAADRELFIIADSDDECYRLIVKALGRAWVDLPMSYIQELIKKADRWILGADYDSGIVRDTKR